jgi:hypothetical protein
MRIHRQMILCAGILLYLGSPLQAGSRDKEKIPVEMRDERFRQRWTVVPSYSYSFFNKGRQAWQEERVEIYFQPCRQLVVGAEIDIMQRPPAGTDIYYSGFANWYATKYLELRGKITFSPNPKFSAKQIYSGGIQYQLAPRIAVMLDYDHFNFVQGPIDQLRPGLMLGITENTFFTVRYVRGWAFGNLEYNYYSAALDIGLPGKRRLNLAVAYGTDPNSEAGSNGGYLNTLSPAWTYSAFFTQPITEDLKIFAGVQYVYRLKRTGGELYQQLTPTIGLAWRF